MTPEVRIKTCCVIKCVNTSSNSKVEFFSFPKGPRVYQRNRWVHTTKNENGSWWMPNAYSFVCSDHFVTGEPSTNGQDTDYVPSVFFNNRKGESIKCRAVSVKKFGLEYIKHGALLERPSRLNVSNDQRKCAYVKLAVTFGIPVTTVRSWERRLRDYLDEKMAEPPDKTKRSAEGKPHWLSTVKKRLYGNPINRAGAWVASSPGGVVRALCAAARARGTLCSTALYNDVRRALRLSSPVNDLHAVWVSAQRVSLQQLQVSARAGDAPHAAPPPAAAAVADLVLLHTDVDIVTDESVTLYEESAALHTLWQLVQRHGLEDAAPAQERARALRWTRAHRGYLDSGRTVSLVVLQRRWYELKLQARVRLATHWRRRPAPQLFDDLAPAPAPAPAPGPTPHERQPRPAPLHIAILKRYPHIATGHLMSWRQQVLEGAIVTEPLEEKDDVKETQSNNDEQSTDTTDTSVGCVNTNISKVEQPTFDEPVVEQPPANDPLTEERTDTDLLEEVNDVKETKSNVNKQSTDTIEARDDAVVKQLYPNMSKVVQPTVDESKNEQTFYNVPLVEQSTANDQLAEHTTENVLLVEDPTVPLLLEPKVEQTIDSDSLTENHMAEQTTDSDLLVGQRTVGDLLPAQTTDSDLLAVQSTVDEPKIEQATDLMINQSTVCTLAENPVGCAGAATADIPDMLDTQGGLDTSNEQIHRAEDNSNEVTPLKRSYSSDIDTDTEDNLVIDEFSNKTPWSFKQEPVPHTEAHSLDTVSPPAAVVNTAPTLEVLHMIDPNMVKTEILFESDEDDFEPCNDMDNDQIELDTKKEVSCISNRIMFADEEPANDSDKSEDDVTGHMDWEDEQQMDDTVNDTPTIDPQLLMETEVPLFRIDKTRAWKNNVRKDQSIRFSRIHKRYYTPNFKYTRYNTKKCTQNTRLDVELRTSPLLHRPTTTSNATCTTSNSTSTTSNATCTTSNSTSNTTCTTSNSTYTTSNATSTKTQEIRVDQSCLEKVANTHSTRQLCRNIKRELIEEPRELLEDETPNKMAKIESDSDDEKPLLVLREGKPPRETADETEDTVVREMVEESSSDDEWLNDDMFYNLRWEERKRGRGSYYAASTIEWSSAFAPALGRVAKRVSLPDIEQVRRYNSSMQVAQVAPITSTVGACGDDAMQVEQPAGDDTAADDRPEAAAAAPAQLAETVASRTNDLPTFNLPRNRDMPEGLLPTLRAKPKAWRTLDLPADDELQAALDDLTTAPAEAVLERSHCCAARRHREVNDTRRRIGLAEIPLHNHPDGVCACCCAHLSDADARQRLDQQLRALHEDIEKMLRKSSGGKIQQKPAQKNSRSSSPAGPSTSASTSTATTSAHKQATSAHKQATSAPKQATSAQKKAISAQKQATSAQKQATSAQKQATSAQKQATSAHKQATSDQKQGTSAHKQATSDQKQATSAHKQATSDQKQGASAQKQATSANKQATKEAPSNTAAVAKGSKANPATYTNRSRKRRSRARAAPDPEPEPPISDYEEWQRQKNMNAKYFHISGTTAQSTTGQTVTKQNTITQSPRPQQNVVQPGLMPYIRQSRLVTPLEQPPHARHANPVPPVQRNTPVNIAPKNTTTQTAVVPSVVVEAVVPSVVVTGLTIPYTNGYQSLAASPRRLNLTTEQVPGHNPQQVMIVNNAPTDKPVSILDEYSRTLSIEPVNNTPVVNALSLRVPSGTQGPKTTILMALTLPSDEVIKKTINRLHANDTVDLTEEPETTTSVIKKTDSKQKSQHTIDLVTAFRSLMTPENKNTSGRSLLKTLTATKSGKSLLKSTLTSALDKPPGTSKPPTIVATSDTASKIMSLSHKLHDGDVIEIDDTDSNQSNCSDGNQSNQSNKSSIIVNKSSNPAVYTKKGSNQAKSITEEGQTTSKTVESLNQAVSNSIEAVNKKKISSNQAITTKSATQAIDDIKKSYQKLCKAKRCKAKPVFKKSNVTVEAVISHLVARPCSRIPVLTSLTDGSQRCPARFANVAAMTDFMATLRRAAAQADKEIYCHKWSAVETPVSALPCGGTLLCVDGSRPPLVLPAVGRRDRRAAPHARAHLVLTDADPPCALPTYWTLSSFGQMARVKPDELLSTDAPDVADAPDVTDAGEAQSRGGGARWCAARGDWVSPKEDRKICEKNHNFKILTAFCSADGIRQAARAGASLLLLSVLRARVVVLTLTRSDVHGVVRHRASADVQKELLRELEGLLDKAEIDEQLGQGADIIDQ